MTVWNIFVGDHGRYLNEFNSQSGTFPPMVASEEGFVAVGWAGIGDMTMYKNNRQMYEQNFICVYPDETPQQRGCLWRFYSEIKNGDWIISRSSHHNCILVGQATENYFYDTEKNNFYAHRTQTYLQHIRSVKWKVIITKSDLRYPLLSGNGGQFTVSESSMTDLDLQAIVAKV